MAAASNNLEEILKPFHQRASEAEVPSLQLSMIVDICFLSSCFLGFSSLSIWIEEGDWIVDSIANKRCICFRLKAQNYFFISNFK